MKEFEKKMFYIGIIIALIYLHFIISDNQREKYESKIEKYEEELIEKDSEIDELNSKIEEMYFYTDDEDIKAKLDLKYKKGYESGYLDGYISGSNKN